MCGRLLRSPTRISSNNVLTFPTQYGVGTASPYQYVTVANAGVVPLYIGDITDTGGEALDFDAPAAPIYFGTCININTNNFPLIVGVGQSCTFGVSFDPSGSGSRSTNIVVDDNTLGTQTQLKVDGTGVYSTTTLAVNGDTAEPGPISYGFPSSSVGTALSETLTIMNTSSVTLVFKGVSTSGIDPGDFYTAATDTCAGQGVEIASGQSCTVEIVFQPRAQGTRNATLNIVDNSPDGGEIINVSGTGS